MHIFFENKMKALLKFYRENLYYQRNSRIRRKSINDKLFNMRHDKADYVMLEIIEQDY